ncbi:MAG: hypothetical protein KDE08_09160 [Rhodobacteraceae bacterium]|nr:hypothetical protein [Paracoccaceae bacterium]
MARAPAVSQTSTARARVSSYSAAAEGLFFTLQGNANRNRVFKVAAGAAHHRTTMSVVIAAYAAGERLAVSYDTLTLAPSPLATGAPRIFSVAAVGMGTDPHLG